MARAVRLSFSSPLLTPQLHTRATRLRNVTSELGNWGKRKRTHGRLWVATNFLKINTAAVVDSDSAI